jgi:hypothetical protein
MTHDMRNLLPSGLNIIPSWDDGFYPLRALRRNTNMECKPIRKRFRHLFFF